jgi:hypothetical protein
MRVQKSPNQNVEYCGGHRHVNPLDIPSDTNTLNRFSDEFQKLIYHERNIERNDNDISLEK